MTDAFAWLGGGSDLAGRAVVAWFAAVVAIIQVCVAAQRNWRRK